MFGFFVSGEFKGFWSNQPGDVFADLTCMKMGWPKQSTHLVYYPGLKEHELENALPTLESVQVRQQQISEPDENGNTETSLVTVKTINADSFMVNGLMLIPC